MHSIIMSGINWRSYFFCYRCRRAKIVTSRAFLRQGAHCLFLSSPAARPQKALLTCLQKGTATLRGEKGRSRCRCKTVQLLPGPTLSSEHQGEPTGRCCTSAAVETLEFPQAVQQEGLKQPWCGWRDGGTGTWFGAWDPWVGDAVDCLTHKLPPDKPTSGYCSLLEAAVLACRMGMLPFYGSGKIYFLWLITLYTWTNIITICICGILWGPVQNRISGD